MNHFLFRGRGGPREVNDFLDGFDDLVQRDVFLCGQTSQTNAAVVVIAGMYVASGLGIAGVIMSAADGCGIIAVEGVGSLLNFV